jgi:hypothetical protein
LKQDEYRAWLDTPCNSPHGGFLWIKGNPGTGKSTLMKFAFDTETRKAKSRRQQDNLVVSFFFNARGNEMEQSVEGMYRALILQVLRGFPDLQELLDHMDIATMSSEGVSLSELEDLFQSIAVKLGSRRVTCFIDALDEGGRQQVVKMVRRFQEVLEDHTAPDSQLRICFSSRHYPFIKPRVGLQLSLEKLPGHSKDLEEYVLGNLDVDSPEEKTDITARLLEKAKGIFLWTVLVVDYLNEDMSKGLSFEERISMRLEQVPEGLSDLFKHLLSQHPADMGTFRLMVSWLLFSKRSLSPRQVDHALWSGAHGDELRSFSPPNFDDPNTENRLRARVIDASKGLAEILASDPPIVQFIHESVRDFLLKDEGLDGFWPTDPVSKAAHRCHEVLKDCCDQYLNHPLMVNVLQGNTQSMRREQRLQFRERVLARFPMLEYACQNILYHADAAAPSFPQEAFLSGVFLPHWTRALNSFESYQSRFYNENTDLLYILAHRGHGNLIRGWSGRISLQLTSLVVTAVEGQREEAFTALLEKILPGFQSTGLWDKFRFRDPIRRCTRRSLITLAAQEGCIKLLERLLHEGEKHKRT